jgi:hypothetical protein
MEIPYYSIIARFCLQNEMNLRVAYKASLCVITHECICLGIFFICALKNVYHFFPVTFVEIFE